MVFISVKKFKEGPEKAALTFLLQQIKGKNVIVEMKNGIIVGKITKVDGNGIVIVGKALSAPRLKIPIEEIKTIETL